MRVYALYQWSVAKHRRPIFLKLGTSTHKKKEKMLIENQTNCYFVFLHSFSLTLRLLANFRLYEEAVLFCAYPLVACNSAVEVVKSS